MTDSAPLLAPRALYIEVAELVRQQIYSGALPPGSWIDEMKVADSYGISRTPLREALKVLATEGLVTMKLRRGAYVTEVSAEDVLQVYHLLALLESDAAATVAQHASSAQLAELQALHAQLQASVATPAAFFQHNEAFHLLLLECCGNRWQRQAVLDLRKVMKLYRQQSLARHGRLADSLREHEAIMQALLERNAQAARQAVQAHFDAGFLAATA